MEEVKNEMEKISLTMEKLVEFADIAVHYDQFPDVSSALLLTCAKFLKTNRKTPAEQLQFAMEKSGEGQEATVLQLLVLARDLPPPECSNCGEKECQDGKLVESVDKFREGCKLRVNCGNSYWGLNGGTFARNNYTFVSVNKHIVKVSSLGSFNDYLFKNGNVATFRYNCC